MPVPRQFMDHTCELITKISCEVAFLTGIVEQLQAENTELKKQLQAATPVEPEVPPVAKGLNGSKDHSVAAA